MREKAFKLLYAPKFHGLVLVLQEQYKYSVTTYVLLQETGWLVNINILSIAASFHELLKFLESMDSYQNGAFKLFSSFASNQASNFI